MSHHPQYLDIFQKAQAFILRGDGPLPFHYRHFIAIMAAGRHRCGYLIEQQMNEFVLANGDKRWLLGLDHIPTKLLDLYEVNKILAHQPWLITKHHIEKLTTGSDSWSLGELVQALVIMSHFHSLASFVFGCGIGNGDHEPPCRSPSASNQSSAPGSPISPKHPPSSTGIGKHSAASAAVSAESRSSSPHSSLPHSLPPSVASVYVGGSNPGSRSNSARSSPEWKNTNRRSSTLGLVGGGGDDDQVGLDALMKRMKSLSERREQFTAEEQIKRYEHVESQSAELGVVSSEQDVSQRGFGQFIKDEGFTYQDFANRGGGDGSAEGGKSLIATFRVQDYSWDDHAYSLINRLYSDVGNLIDEKFRLTYHLTYYTMGSNKSITMLYKVACLATLGAVAGSGSIELSSTDISRGSRSLDNIKATWSQALKVLGNDATVSAEYDRAANKDFVKEATLSGKVDKVKYELTTNFAGATDLSLSTTTSDGTTIEAETSMATMSSVPKFNKLTASRATKLTTLGTTTDCDLELSHDCAASESKLKLSSLLGSGVKAIGSIATKGGSHSTAVEVEYDTTLSEGRTLSASVNPRDGSGELKYVDSASIDADLELTIPLGGEPSLTLKRGFKF